MPLAGAGTPMSSHQTSSSGVSTTLVKMVFLAQDVERVRIGFGRSAGRDAEESRFRIHRVKPSVLADANPRDVVAERGHLPAGQRRLHHGEVGFAASAGERGGDVIFFLLRRGEAEDEHVLRHPAFAFGHGRGDAQRETFLAEQRVAAVAGTVGPDGRIVRKMDDVFLLRIGFARPGNVLLSRLQRRADRVHARNEIARSRRACSCTSLPMRVMMRMLTTT